MTQHRSPRITRRRFVAAASTLAAAGAAPYFVPARCLGAGDAPPPSDQLAVGIIGAGGMGGQHLAWLLDEPEVRVRAVCDVDASHLTPAVERTNAKYGDKDCLALDDFRELAAAPELDVVYVTTPDHWHVLASLAALRAGKDVYCEKPLANSVAEGRLLSDEVKNSGRILQCGSHERSNPNCRLAAKLIAEGRIGQVKTVRIRLPCDEPHHTEARKRTQAKLLDPPPGFDYDRWLGPTAEVPFAENRCHFWWRFNHRYGGGEMTDRGAHIIDLAQLILGEDASGPVEYSAQGIPIAGDLYDVFLDFTFENRYASGVVMIGEKTGPRGIGFEGTEGSLFLHIHGGKLEATPGSILDREYPGDPMLPYAVHRRNFLDAVKNRVAPNATAEIGHRTATICHLNNLAMRLGRKLAWDPVKEQIENDDEANELLTPKYREPWKLG